MLSVTPILQTQRDLFAIPSGPARFHRYLAVMTGGTDDVVLPLQSLNPAGKAHVAEALDALIAIGAEEIAAQAVAETIAATATAVEAEPHLKSLEANLRVALVVADDVAGGWTNRELIEARRMCTVPKAMIRRGWMVVVYWASEPVTRQKVREEVLTTLYRDAYLMRRGEPKTLRDVMALEGAALAFAGASEPWLSAEDLEYTRDVIQVYLDAPVFEEFPTVFACMYGDEAARRVGYPALGFSRRAGCAVALAATFAS